MYKILMTFIVITLLGCNSEAPTGSDKVTEIPAPVADPIEAPEEQVSDERQDYLQRIGDLQRIEIALADYRAENGQYPRSNNWQGRYSKQGELTEDYIVGLAPDFIEQLPVDPRHSNNRFKNYLYRSNGVDYKFIVHGAPAYDKKTVDYNMVDRKRPDNAYGVWTPGAEDW